MAYEVTATRRRPKDFNSLYGQEFVSSTLKNSIATGRIAHAYCFSGPRGCGKTSTARILAKALNCEKGPTQEPCGVCDSCVSISKGTSIDVFEIDGASNTSVENVRQIKDEVLFPPVSSKYKIYIIDEVHMLSNSAFNALLKTIEEPPPYVIFMFATTEIHKVPATIKSRCQLFNLRLFPLDTIHMLLAQAAEELHVTAEEDALFWIAKESTGSMRDAYTLFDQVVAFSDNTITMDKIKKTLSFSGLDDLNEIAEFCIEKNPKSALSKINDLIEAGVSVEQSTIDFSEYWRSILLIKQGIESQVVLGFPLHRYSEKVLKSITVTQAERMLSFFLDLYRTLRYSVSPKFELELVISRMASITSFLSSGEIGNEIIELKRKLASGKNLTVQTETETAIVQEIEKKNENEFDDIIEEDTSETNIEESGVNLKIVKQTVVAKIKKTKAMVAATLEKSKDWSLEDTILVIPFKAQYEMEFVKQDTVSIAAIAQTLLGKMIKVELRSDTQAKKPEVQIPVDDTQEIKDENITDPVKIVEHVFRGTIISEIPQGGDNESI